MDVVYWAQGIHLNMLQRFPMLPSEFHMQDRRTLLSKQLGNDRSVWQIMFAKMEKEEFVPFENL